MKKIDFQEPNSIAWNKWKEKCDRATKRIIKAVNENKEWKKGTVYNEQKKVYKDIFKNKCGYCQVELREQEPLDHYRPAKEVTDENYKRLNQHPGYYWLVNYYKNLIPACSSCNTWIGSGENKRGKQCCFPIEDENNRAYFPGDEVNEKPLLYNPYFDDPFNDFELDRKDCVIKWKSEKGRTTIKVLGLYERYENLCEKWKLAYKEVKDELARIQLKAVYTKEEVLLERKKYADRIKSNEFEFSFVRISAFNDFRFPEEEIIM